MLELISNDSSGDAAAAFLHHLSKFSRVPQVFAVETTPSKLDRAPGARCYRLLCLTLCRMMHADRRSLQNAVRNILDGELLSKYLHLSTMERSDLAKKIGTTQDIVSAPPTDMFLDPSTFYYLNIL